MLFLSQNGSAMSFRFIQTAYLTAVILFSATSHADEPTTENRALAEVLFRDAKTLSDAQQFEQACPKFQESHRLDPKPGTVLNLAVCHEKQGKIASAWLDYIEAATFAARAGQKDREAFAKEQAAKLEKMLSRLAVRVPKKTPGLVVKLDSAPMNEAVWGSAVPINPGNHSVEGAAPGYTTWSKTITIEPNSGNVDIVVPELEAEKTDKPIEKLKDPEAKKDAGTSGQEKPKEHGSNAGPQKSEFNKPLWIGVAAGGVGLVGVILGSALGARTFDLRDAANAECGPPPNTAFCTKKGIDLNSQAQTSAAISTTGFVVGGVGLAAGAVLVFLGMRHASPAPAHAWVLPQVGPTVTGVSAGMSF